MRKPYGIDADSYDNYYNLGCAIVEQAVNDYRFWTKKIGKVATAQYEIKSIERFFESAWCDLLSPVPGDVILKQLKNGETK